MSKVYLGFLSGLSGVFLVISPFPGRAESFLIWNDGSVALSFHPGTRYTERAVFHFGLPPAPTRAWRERDVLRTTWLTNGVRYTETALMTQISLGTNDTNSSGGTPILLVNIEGENITNQYAEAWVNLSLECGGNPLELVLKDGFVWQRQSGSNSPVCALDISDSGIKSTEGKVLRFSGNIPPSLKGSMTLKIPVESSSGEAEFEALRLIDFEEELRKALKGLPRSVNNSPSSNPKLSK